MWFQGKVPKLNRQNPTQDHSKRFSVEKGGIKASRREAGSKGHKIEFAPQEKAKNGLDG